MVAVFQAGIQKECAESVGALGTAAAKINHDLANPLNAISTSVQLLERCLEGNLERETVTGLIQGLKQENARVQALIGELRQFTRPLELKLEAVNLAELLSDISHEVRLISNGHSVELEQGGAKDLPVVMADRERLTRVLLNLCKNSLEAMPDGGKLTLRCYARGKNTTVERRQGFCGYCRASSWNYPLHRLPRRTVYQFPKELF